MHTGDTLQMDIMIREECLDEFDARGVPSELLQFWAAQEAQLFSWARPAEVPEAALPAGVRAGILHVITDLMGLSRNRLLDVALLLDLYCFRRGVSRETLPATCIAVVTLLKKSADVAFSVDQSALSQCASQFAQLVNKLGYATCEEVSGRDIFKQEEELLVALGWHVNAPSVEKWISVFCDRFDALTNHEFTSSLEWMYEKSLAVAVMLVMQCLTAVSAPPHHMANGLFGLFLVTARLLPFDALRPPKVPAPEWEGLYLDSVCQDTLPSCGLPAEASGDMLRMAHLATGSDIPTLQADAYAIISIMKHVNTQSGRQPHSHAAERPLAPST